MSAAAKPWKVQVDHDRRSNMVTSSINAPAKKDGAGGSYTWGSAMDVIDYEPVGMGHMKKVVTMASAPAAPPVIVQQTPVSISDTAQFPTLGGQPTASPTTSVRWAAPAAAVYQAPPQPAPQPAIPATSVKIAPATKVVTAAPQLGAAPQTIVVGASATAPQQVSSVIVGSSPRVVLGEEMLRQSATNLDATHPRNTFARKPHRQSTGAPVPEVQDPAPAIDWTAAGTTAFQQQVIHAVAQNPAHLGPYVEAKPGPTVSVLRTMPSPAAFVPQNPKLDKKAHAQPRVSKPQVMYQRKC